MTAAIKPIANESAAGQGRAEILAKAAESLCAACLTKSKEKCRAHKQSAFWDAYRRGERRWSPLREKPRAYAECRLCRKRAKNACEGRCKADGKRVEQEKRTSHSGSAGTLRKSRVGERKTKRKNR